MGSRESRATPVSGVRQLREHGPAWDVAATSNSGSAKTVTCSKARSRKAPTSGRTSRSGSPRQSETDPAHNIAVMTGKFAVFVL